MRRPRRRPVPPPASSASQSPVNAYSDLGVKDYWKRVLPPLPPKGRENQLYMITSMGVVS
jgi:hypothetical protein